MKKFFKTIGFYVVFFSILFGIGFLMPWIIIGLGIGALLIGISKCLKMAFLGLHRLFTKKNIN